MELANPAKSGSDDEASDDETPKVGCFAKTKMCRFQLLGICARGSQCQFAHDRKELRPLPDFTRTKLCKVLRETGICSNKSCLFAHNVDELRSFAHMLFKTKMCRFHLTGHCSLGSRCNFAHSTLEVRDMLQQEEEEMMQLELPAGPLSASGASQAAARWHAPVALPPGAVTVTGPNASAVPPAPPQPQQPQQPAALRGRRRQSRKGGQSGGPSGDDHGGANTRPHPDSVISLDASIPQTGGTSSGVDMGRLMPPNPSAAAGAAGATNSIAATAAASMEFANLLRAAAAAVAAAGIDAANAAAAKAAAAPPSIAPGAAPRREELLEAAIRSQAATFAGSSGARQQQQRPSEPVASISDQQWANSIVPDSPIYVVTPETSMNWRGGPSSSLQQFQHGSSESEGFAGHGMGRAPVGRGLKPMPAREQAGPARSEAGVPGGAPSLSVAQAASRHHMEATHQRTSSSTMPAWDSASPTGFMQMEGNSGTGFRDALRSAGLPWQPYGGRQMEGGQAAPPGLESGTLFSKSFDAALGPEPADEFQTSGLRRAHTSSSQDMAQTYSDVNEEDEEQVWAFLNEDVSPLTHYTTTRIQPKPSGLRKPMSGSTICTMADRASNHSRTSSISGSPAADP